MSWHTCDRNTLCDTWGLHIYSREFRQRLKEEVQRCRGGTRQKTLHLHLDLSRKGTFKGAVRVEEDKCDNKVKLSECWDDTVAGSPCKPSDPSRFGLPCASWTRSSGALQHGSGCSGCSSGQQPQLLFVQRETHHAAAQQEAGLVPAAGRTHRRWKHKAEAQKWLH